MLIVLSTLESWNCNFWINNKLEGKDTIHSRLLLSSSIIVFYAVMSQNGHIDSPVNEIYWYSLLSELLHLHNEKAHKFRVFL